MFNGFSFDDRTVDTQAGIDCIESVEGRDIVRIVCGSWSVDCQLFC